MLVQAAQGAVKQKGSYYQAKFNSLTFRLGSANKAKVAIANRIARCVFHIIKNKARFKDLGPLRADSKDQQIKRALSKLKSLGVTVQFHHHQKIIEAKREITVAV